MDYGKIEDFLKNVETKDREILLTKNADYSNKEDGLSNFKYAAKRLGLTPYQIWAVYAGKHWDAIMAFCRDGKVESEDITLRIHDLRNYAFLLLGLLEDEANDLIERDKGPKLPGLGDE